MKGIRLFLFIALALSWSLSAGAQEPPETLFVRLPSADYDPAITPAVRTFDYGSFVWLEIKATDLEKLRTAGLTYQVVKEPFTLHLGGTSFDPWRAEPDLPAGWDSVHSDGPDLHLVQFAGPTRAGWLARLQRDGLAVVQYLHPFTYVVWGRVDDLNRADADFVRWTGPFAPAYRVLPRWRGLDEQPYRVDVLLYRGADVDAALEQIIEPGGELYGRAVLNDTFEIASLALPGTRLGAAARVPGVYSIQLEPTDGGLRGEMSNQVNVNNVDGSNQAFPGYRDWLNAVGLDGSGVIVANVDAGVQESHPDLVNRFVSCTGTTCGGSASDAHGTHTAGIMAADGASGVTDSYGFLRGLGVAPGANLVEQVYSPFYYSEPNGMLLLMSDSYQNGALLSGNSWGPAGSPQGYDNDTMQVDIGVRDALSTTAGNQQFNYILSIMNGNGGTSTQGSPDEAKNIFTIGSTKLQNSDGSQNLDINDLSSNSAHGPALDGRKIPHMVAPGCRVDSTVTGSGYSLMCGTSMASPHVSGAVALFIEYYRQRFGVDPSPALVKAAFLPVAHDLADHRDADGNLLSHPFDSKQGWGRMDLAAVVSPTVPVQYFDNPTLFDDTGQTWTQVLAPADPDSPMRLMLVWTDAPGHGLGGSTPAWNNDLDLVVEAGGEVYRGNQFGSDGWSQTGGSADGMNNTEGIFLGPTAPESVTVQVVASNINSDGVPGQGDITDQDFGLVCYNCTSKPDYVLSADPNRLQACAPDVVTSTLRVDEILTYSHPVTLTALGVPSGVAAQVSPSIVLPSGVATLTLDLGGTTPPGDYRLTVSGTAQVTNVHAVKVDLLVDALLTTTPDLLAPADGATDLPYEAQSFDWAALSQARHYDFQLDAGPTFAQPEIEASAIPTHAYTLETALGPSTCYFWRVRGENACNQGSWSAPFRFSTLGLATLFSDDMEAGDGQWHETVAQGVARWTLVDSQAHSPDYAWFVEDDDVTTDSRLQNSVAVTLAPSSTLTFWHRFDFESNWDGGVLEISTDGGSDWVDLEDKILSGGYNRTLNTSVNPLSGRPAWSGSSGGWTAVEVDLTGYAGEPAFIRWRAGSDGSVADDGWYVDDVQITAPLPPNPAPSVSHVTPAYGLSSAATPVQIDGSGFVPTPYVQLGETWLLSVTRVNSTTLEAVVPAGMAKGTHDLTLYNGDCQAAGLADAFNVFDRCIAPQVTLGSDGPALFGQPLSFSAALITGTPPLTLTWDFGGPGQGTGLEGFTPVFTYTDFGTFTTTLAVTNPCGSDTASDVVQVLCYEPEPDFLAGSPALLGQAMAFTATATGTLHLPLTYTWDFGGPGYGVGLDTAKPVFTYTGPGLYSVTLTVESPCGANTASHAVEVLCYPPWAELNTSSPALLGQAMAFTATLTGTVLPPLTYTWDFGGPGYGVGLDTATPRYTFTLPGEFTAAMTATNRCGYDRVDEAVTVCGPVDVVTINGPTSWRIGAAAAYTATHAPLTASLPVTFTWNNGTVGPSAVYSWTRLGVYSLTVSATNVCPTASAVETTTNVTLAGTYLPVVMRDWAVPGTP